MFQAARSVTSAQIRKLWVLAKSAGLSDADLHRLVREVTGKESVRLLTCEEASRAIDRLARPAAKPTERPPARQDGGTPPANNVIELATERQIDMIGHLLWDLGWQTNDPYFRACVRRAIGRENVRTKREASKVIDMLRAKVKELGLEGEIPPASGGRQADEAAGIDRTA